MIKNNFRILKKQYAYLQTILKTPVKFQKDSPKTVGGVADTRYILHIHICSIRARKMSKLKMGKKVIKNNFRILKKQYAYLQTILKTPVKFQKDWPKTVGGVADTRMVVGDDGRTDGRTDGQTDRQTDRRTDTQNFGGYNIIPRHFLVAGHKNWPRQFRMPYLFALGSFATFHWIIRYPVFFAPFFILVVSLPRCFSQLSVNLPLIIHSPLAFISDF